MLSFDGEYVMGQERPQYRLDGDVRRLNIAALPLAPDLATDLNGVNPAMI